MKERGKVREDKKKKRWRCQGGERCSVEEEGRGEGEERRKRGVSLIVPPSCLFIDASLNCLWKLKLKLYSPY